MKTAGVTNFSERLPEWTLYDETSGHKGSYVALQRDSPGDANYVAL